MTNVEKSDRPCSDVSRTLTEVVVMVSYPFPLVLIANLTIDLF